MYYQAYQHIDCYMITNASHMYIIEAPHTIDTHISNTTSVYACAFIAVREQRLPVHPDYQVADCQLDNLHSAGTVILYRVSFRMRSKSCCSSTSTPVDPAILLPSVVYRAALSIPPSSSCKLKRKSLAVSERGRRVNWQVSFRDGRGTFTTGRPFWIWMEASAVKGKGKGGGGERRGNRRGKGKGG